MKILIDLQGAQSESRFRGIGRYTLSIVESIIKNRGSHEIIMLLSDLLLGADSEVVKTLLPASRSAVRLCVWKAPRGVKANTAGNELRCAVAEQLRLSVIECIGPDVVYIPSLFEGYVDDSVISIDDGINFIPTVVTLYDLIPLLQPETFFSGQDRFETFYLGRLQQLRKASRLLAISESSAAEARSCLQIERDHVINVSAACGEQFSKRNVPLLEEERLKGLFGIDRPFVLCSGAADARKNLLRLITAFARLPDQVRDRHQLVFAGKMGPEEVASLRAWAEDCGLSRGDVRIVGYVTDEDLNTLYQLCDLFVLPSLHEGFGFPALEAMLCGAVVIGSRATSVPEVIGCEEALFDPLDEDAIGQKIFDAITDQSLRDRLLAHAAEQVRKFSWDRTGLQAIRVFEDVASASDPNQGQDFSWQGALNRWESIHQKLLSNLALLLNHESGSPSADFLAQIAESIEHNERQVDYFIRDHRTLSPPIRWRLEGPFEGSYSLASVNREVTLALQDLGHDVAIHYMDGPGDLLPDADFLRTNPEIRRAYERGQEMQQVEADVTSRNMYPPRVADMRSRLNLLHSYAWEETGFPFEWVLDFNQKLQGIAVVSGHVKKILIDNGVSVPVLVTGNGISHWQSIRPDEDFRLSAKSFRFLHVSSCFPRKGVDALLNAYGQAFSSEDDVTLVIKTFANPHNLIHQWLDEVRQQQANYPDVQILDHDISAAELKALYGECQVLVAPSRAEGFGLPMAEAMLSGLAVITTAWGGQVDFCTEHNSWLVDYDFERAETHFNLFESVWANPRIESLVQAMLDVYHSPAASRARRSDLGRQVLLDRFKWHDVGEKLVQLACRSIQRFERLQPRIGWITTWNTRCGIASYSEHLISNMPVAVTVFAAEDSRLIRHDDGAINRCWSASEQEDLSRLGEQIDLMAIDVLVIQFNYGFFNLDSLNNFIHAQKSSGRIIILMMHATIDPTHAPEKRLSILTEAMRLCDRILVHSPHDMNRLKRLGLIDNVSLFPHGVANPVGNIAFPGHANSRRSPAKRAYIVASYGFFLPHKGLLELIDAVHQLHRSGMDICLKMVNSEYPAPESSALICEARQRIAWLGMEHRVTMITDYLSDQDSLSELSGADLIIFPYQKTQESSSAAVRYGLSTGVPVAVTPLPIFEDVRGAAHVLPGPTSADIAAGIEVILSGLSSGSAVAREVHASAELWRRQHDYAALGKRLAGMIVALSQETLG